jgi:hypothetical protein
MDPDPTLDPTPFFIDFKDAKEKKIFIFFSHNLQQAHHLQSKKFNFLLKFCVKFLFCRHYFSPLNTLMRKRKDPDPGGPKTCGSGSPILHFPKELFEK